MKTKISALLIVLILIYGCSPNSNTSNSSSNTVTDIDGNAYQLVTICNQTWMKSNLNVSHYRNGDVIPQVTDASQWVGLTTGAWCYYANTSSNGTTYGKLYNWYAVNDPRGLAPVGYHVPTIIEWTTLTDNCLGGSSIAGGSMKEVGTTHWNSPNTAATNSSGFTALPGSFRHSNDGSFYIIGVSGYWWCSSEVTSTTAWYGYMSCNYGFADRADTDKTSGNSVRCIKD